jgi:hypothetical protein
MWEWAVKTDDLIGALSHELAPVSRTLVARRLGLGLALGMVATFLILVPTLRLRPDLGHALGGAAFWVKFIYTLALAALGLWLVERQSRAAADARMPALLLLVPVVLLAAVAALQISAPQADWRTLAMGHTARVCSSLILAFSLPIFVGTFWAMRTLAPTRLTLAGGSAGLLSGAASAALYCLHCPEAAAPFILIWYSLGILLAAGLGAVIGRWTLRW